MKLLLQNETLHTLVKREHIFTLSDSEKYEEVDMVLFKNPDFVLEKQKIIDDSKKELDFLWYPDYEKSRLFFCRDDEDVYFMRSMLPCNIFNDNDIQLAVEIFPRPLTYKEKEAILSSADKEDSEGKYSDYFKMLDMFDEVDNMLNTSCPVGVFDFYDIDLSQEEKQLLMHALQENN